jgi:large subunit ribosomal protein L33
MAKSKFSENLIKMKCGSCSRVGYFTRKNKKSTEKKLVLSKHCGWCRKHTPHKEAKR